jgi:membrane associated rhomboid family serine protease
MNSILEDIQSSFNKGNNAIRKLLFLNIGIFVLISIISKLRFMGGDVLVLKLALPHAFKFFYTQPWSLFTYIFLHGGIWHLLSNMLFLYFIGSIFRDFVGNKAIYHNFIFGGIAGGLLYLVIFSLIPPYANAIEPIRMVGASGGVTAIIVAAAVLTPNYELQLFGLFSVKLKWIALFRVLYDLIGFGDGNNDGGQLAHLGGAAFGYLYVKWLNGAIRFPILSDVFSFKRKSKPKRKFKVHLNTQEPTVSKETNTKPSQKEIDLILDKISKSGYDSLSNKEKETLFKASKEF